MKKAGIFFMVIGLGVATINAASGASQCMITVPVATVWTEKGGAAERMPTRLGGPVFGSFDIRGAGMASKSDTQLLYGDYVTVLQQEGDWLYVSFACQEAYNRRTDMWSDYRGWINAKCCSPVDKSVKKNAVVKTKTANVVLGAVGAGPALFPQLTLSLGTGLHVIGRALERGLFVVDLPDGVITGHVPFENVLCVCESIDARSYSASKEAELRSAVCAAAQELVGAPYIWGGCSAYAPEWACYYDGVQPGWMTGPDCSGLVYLAYRAAGLEIPRNAHPQFAKATPVSLADLLPGDLLFYKSAQSNFAYVYHVLLYLGDDKFIEASGPDGCVRIVDFRTMSGGQSIHDCNVGQPAIELARAEAVSETAATTALVCQSTTVELWAGTFLRDAAKVTQARDRFLAS